MSQVAALPMYDWPEIRAETDALWSQLAKALRSCGVEAPERLARNNAALPPVPGGIRDEAGTVIAADPADLPSDELDLQALWHHPHLLLAQTCWGPMSAGLHEHVQLVGQPDYSSCEGGAGACYSSAVLMRRGEGTSVAAPPDGGAVLPLDRMQGMRLAYNEPVSMSGYLALLQDIGSDAGLFAETVATGSHRASARAVAEGRADLCAVDCRSWALIQRFEPYAAGLVAVGWTARRKGLPYITSRYTAPNDIRVLRRVLALGD